MQLIAVSFCQLNRTIPFIPDIDEVRPPELILEYVKKYGPISNRQVRELLGVDIYKASKLLNKLVKDSNLVKLGTSNKIATYGLKDH